MDSLDAECLLIGLAEREIRPPDLWRHDSSGALSCAYEGGESVFTWSAAEVAEMARTWRASDPRRVPEQVQFFLEADQRLEALAAEAGLGPADMMIHDLGRAELWGIWENEEVALVVEAIGEAASRAGVN